MAHLKILLLGSLQVALAGQPVTAFKSDKVRALLAYLAVEADRPHRREVLAALLWPEMPDQAARSNLRDVLSNLRQVTGDREADPPFLLITRDTLQFNVHSDHWIDVAEFHELVDVDPDGASPQQLAEAVALYRGCFLEGFSLKDSATFEDWSLLTREQFQRQALMALRRLAQHHEGRGEYGRAGDYAWRRVELEPWEEEAHQQLMRLLALSGQRGAALAQYETCRRLLTEELGVEASVETTRLYEAIRDGELRRPPGAPPGPPEQEPRRVGECPYRGLAAFREADAPFFFGRETFTRQLIDIVRQRPMVVAIVGSSGSGKSSTVFAGMLPHLRDETNWLIAHFRPGGQPFYALTAALLPFLEPDLSETERLLEARKLADALRQGKVPLVDAVERALQKSKAANCLLLVVDQFEELYTFCPELEVRRRLLDELLAAVEAGSKQRSPTLVLLLTLRADFMGHALAYRPFADALQDAPLLMGPMSRDELRLAIEEPAGRQGAAFEPGLVERLLDDVGDEPGNLPLLEFSLTLLWERQTDGRLTHSDYEETGRVEGALARHADQVFGELGSAEQKGAQRIFVQLVRPGEGTEDTRRAATHAELGDENWELVQHLADTRLVVTGRDVSGREIVEVVHEALIQRWGRLRAWMDAGRAFRTWQEGLRTALRGWKTSDCDDGALLRGAPLARAEGWLAERGCELGEAERGFIQASLDLRELKQTARERRRRRTILALAGGLLIAIALATFAFNARRIAQREADVNHSLVLAASAEQAFENGETDLALALALEAVHTEQPPTEAHRVLSAIALGPGTRAILAGHSHSVRGGAFSPDGRMALSGSCAELNPAGDCVQGELILWDLESGTELHRLEGHTDWINGVAFAPDALEGTRGKAALSGSGDGSLILWDVSTGQAVRRFEGHAGGVNSVALSPETRTLAGGQTALSGSDDGTLILWDVATGEAIRRFEGHSGGVMRVAFNPAPSEVADGQTALSASRDATIILWDVATGEAIRRFEGHTNSVKDVAFHPDGRTILSIGDDFTLRSWDLKTGKETHRHEFLARPGSLATTSDGRTAVFSIQHDLHQWDVSRWQEIGRLAGHEVLADGSAAIHSIDVSHDGRLALSASDDGTLRLWNLEGQIESRRFETGATPMLAVAVSPDGSRLLTGGVSGDATLWDVDSGQTIHRFEGDGFSICPDCVALSPGGRQALVAAEDVFGDSGATSLVLWDVETGQEIRRLEGHVTYVRSVAFSPDGRTALAGSQSMPDNSEGDLILWDLKTGRQIRRFGITHDVTNIAVSADGSRALTGSATDSVAILWDVASGRAVRRFEGHTGPVLNVAFGPEEQTILTASYDGSLALWDVDTGEIIRRYLGHDQAVWGLDVSPGTIEGTGGPFAISSSESGTVILWGLDTGQELDRFRAHTGWAADVAFGPDGQTAFSVGFDGALIQWQIADPSLDDLISWIHTNRYVRDLTCAEREQYRVEPLCEAE